MNNSLKTKMKIFAPVIAVFVTSVYIGFSMSKQEAIADTNEIMVYKSATCGCCKKWVKHLEDEGFNITSKNMQDMNGVKNKIGVKPQYRSCHTAKIGNYYIEGHVPAKDIKKLLRDKPDVKGLAVPGMPMGSPGMEGHRKDRYEVIAVDKKNNASVYSQY